MTISEAKKLIIDGISKKEKFSIMVGTQEIYNNLVGLLNHLHPENKEETLELSIAAFEYFKQNDLIHYTKKKLVKVSLNLIDDTITKLNNYENLNYLNVLQCVYILDFVFKLNLEYEVSA